MYKTLMILPVYKGPNEIYFTVCVSLNDIYQYEVYEVYTDGQEAITKRAVFNRPGDAFDNAFRRAGWNVRTEPDF